MKKPLPPYLREVLASVCNNQGEDIHFALGYLSDKASSYMSRLKARGLAYTVRMGGTVEVWATALGWDVHQSHADAAGD